MKSIGTAYMLISKSKKIPYRFITSFSIPDKGTGNRKHWESIGLLRTPKKELAEHLMKVYKSDDPAYKKFQKISYWNRQRKMDLVITIMDLNDMIRENKKNECRR